jgi:uncharacterized membrane protein
MIKTERERGAAIVLVAIALPVLVLLTSFAIDLGRQRTLRRDLQADADVVALDLVRLIDTSGQPPAPAVTLSALNASRQRNGMSTVTTFDGSDRALVQWGKWTEPAPNQQCPLTIVSQPPTCFVAGVTPANAVRVVFDDQIDYYLQPGEGQATRAAVARLGTDPTGEFVMGSTLASLDPGSGWLLAGILGSVIPGAGVLGYNGLLDAQISLFDLAAALNLASPDALADTTVTFEELVIASIDALQASDADPAAKAAGIAVLNDLLTLGVPDADVAVGDLVGAGTSGDSGLAGSVSIPQLLALAGLELSNSSNAISIPSSAINFAGLTGVTLDLSAVEAPVRVGTQNLADGTTSQVDLGVRINIDISSQQQQQLCTLPLAERTLLGQLLGGLFQTLNCVLAPLTQALLDVRVAGTIDLDLSLAEVWARQSIDCTQEKLTIDYDADPATITPTVNLATTASFGGKPVNLLGVQLPGTALAAGGSAGSVLFDVTDAGPRFYDFDRLDGGVSSGEPSARIGAPNLDLANALTVGGLKITVANQNLPAIGGIARNLVAPVLNGLLGTVDQFVLSQVSALLGLNLGGADITPDWMECDKGGVRLVG